MSTYIAKRYGRGEWIPAAARLVNYAIVCGVLAYLVWIVASWIAGVVIGWVFA